MCLIGVPGRKRDYGTQSEYDEIMIKSFIEHMRHPSPKRKKQNPHIDSVVIDTSTKGEKSREDEMKVTFKTKSKTVFPK